VGAEGIVRAARERLRLARRTTLNGVSRNRLTLEVVIDRALAGDAAMVATMADVGRTLGVAAAATLCVTDSTAVLLCGPTLRAGDLIAKPFTDMLHQRCPFAAPVVRIGRLGRRAGTLGAAALVLTDFV